MSRYVRFAGHRTADLVQQGRRVDAGLVRLQTALSQAVQFDRFQRIARTYGFSAPLVETMAAVSSFEKHLPNDVTFNLVPEHKTSARQQLGLEALNTVVTQVDDELKESATSVVDALRTRFDTLAETAADFKSQLAYAHSLLEHTDVADEVIASLTVTTLTYDGFDRIFTMLEQQLDHLDTFDTQDLVAHPENVKAEVDAVWAVVQDIGAMIGLAIDYRGIVDVPKDAAYGVRTQTLEELELSKSSLIFLLAKAETVCDKLTEVAERKDAILESLTAAVTAAPEQLQGDDVVYAAADHFALFGCYSKLVSSLIDESVVTVGRLLATTEAVFENEAEPVDNEAAVSAI